MHGQNNIRLKTLWKICTWTWTKITGASNT